MQSLLSAARLQSGPIEPRLDWCDLPDIIQSALRETAELLNEHTVEKHLPAKLPLVLADFELLQQALENLLANAAMHTPKGTLIEISAHVEADKLVLQVSDRGPGLAEEDQERIFNSFYRSPTAKPGGTGLGLTIVKGFIEAQGGEVRASNRPSGGATFTLIFPLREPPKIKEDTI